jgi:arginyl-tRNA--protein-N-Asp/Glu arginylyltransferase
MDYKSRFRPLEILGATGWQRFKQDAVCEQSAPPTILPSLRPSR